MRSPCELVQTLGLLRTVWRESGSEPRQLEMGGKTDDAVFDRKRRSRDLPVSYNNIPSRVEFSLIDAYICRRHLTHDRVINDVLLTSLARIERVVPLLGVWRRGTQST